MNKLWNVLILAVFLAGCSPKVVETSAPTSSPTAEAPVGEVREDLGRFFKGFDGTFVMYDLNEHHLIHYNPERSGERLLPASTFKVMNSLISLETGAVADADTVIQWDGTRYEIEAWNRDQTMRTAIQDSVVWFYQELARRVGQEKMAWYVKAAGYGNEDISGNIDTFWLDGALRISANEQARFMERLYMGHLPFSEKNLKTVREITVQEKTNNYTLHGKTGSVARMGPPYAGWYVGYVEKADNVYFFAANIKGETAEANGVTARGIAVEVLKELKVLE